ncbi:flavin reductase family protein [Nocardioides insulae]|uniref:flavin reductase family protein n=1 Tax=Nocardioides insulae TaxID=394734 RepID=UPI0003F7B26E|nr:flavin reductase family protein [Nocardioides insulae]
MSSEPADRPAAEDRPLEEGPPWGSEVEDELASFDNLVERRAARRFRDVMGHFASGITVVTAQGEHDLLGLTCQSFTSVSLDPPLVLFVPAHSSRAWPLIREVGRFCVNVLSADQEWISDQFAGRWVPGITHKYDGVEWSRSPVTGSPLITGSLAFVDCSVDAVHPAGDHDIVVGRVHAMGHAETGAPLLYDRGHYRTSR